MSEATIQPTEHAAAPAPAAGHGHAPAPTGDVWGGGVRPYGAHSKKFGMWLFIVSDSITFAALLFAYSFVRMANLEWPTPFHAASILKSTTMTFVLLSSSLTMVLAVDRANKKQRDKASFWIMMTALGGLAFVVLHSWEWIELIHEWVQPAKAANGGVLPMMWGTFFAATGMHMLHVTAGVFYLVGLALQYKGGKFKPIDVEVAGLYWHFVDLVWMFVFPLIYLMSTKIE